MKSYLRFGNIPKDKISKAHRSDAIIRNEAGVSVWNCAFVNNVPFPLLPDNASEDAMADYFYFLLGNRPVYLVTGTELKERGSVNEPLLGNDIEIVEEYTDDYEYLKSMLKERKSENDSTPVTPQPQTGQWIPVSEKLPEKDKSVLLTLCANSSLQGFNENFVKVMCGSYSPCEDKRDWLVNEVRYYIDNVVAWMPLPGPYKAESEDTE